MTQNKVEVEIEEISVRIHKRQSEIQSELSSLERKTITYSKWAWGFVWAGIIVGLLSIFYFIRTNTECGFALNLLGDFLGGSVASLWALAGLFFIYVAFLGQKQQLLNQQLELMYSQLEVKYTRLELAGQKAEMAEQNKTLKKQKFENTFFQLITIHTENVKSIDIRPTQNSSAVLATGRDCFEMFYEKIDGQIRNSKNANLTLTIAGYLKFYDSNKNDLEHYFRHLYHIVKFVDNSDIEDKKTYSNFIRAQLSSFELVNIFYNGLTEYGFDKMKPLIEKYALLKNLNRPLIFNPEHLSSYKKQAFGE